MRSYHRLWWYLDPEISMVTSEIHGLPQLSVRILKFRARVPGYASLPRPSGKVPKLEQGKVVSIKELDRPP